MMRQFPEYAVDGNTGLAFVEADGVRRDLGNDSDPRTRGAYDRMVAESLADVRYSRTAPEELTVAQLADSFLEYAETHYRTASGERTTGFQKPKSALKALTHLYGDTLA
jgi:hypothetical protein